VINPGSTVSTTAASIRLMATFTRINPSYTPELDYWSVSWIANAPPNAPSNPNPSDGETGVAVDEDLSWTCSDPDGDPLTFDIYFGTNSNPPLVQTGWSQTTYEPGTMNYGTTYYWKIIAFDDHGASTSSPIWDFTTWVNNPPNPPSNPSPSNGATNVGVNDDLSWTCSDPDGDSLTYDVYFDTVNPPVNIVSTGQSQTTYDPGTMIFGTTYYWKIVAEDSYGATTTGPVWSFTTTGNDPPNIPSNPSPSNGAINVDVDSDFSWTGGDPNGDDVTYDVYFGETNPPPLIYSNFPDTTYDPGTMQFGTTYYWKIVARDTHGATTTGPIWSFTTGSNDPPYTPTNPDPQNGATEIEITYTISWDGGDPNPGDSITYDLYFGSTNPPNIFRRDLSDTFYLIDGMSYNTMYYWKVIAKDSHGEETEGPVWQFKTKTGSGNDPPHMPVISGPRFLTLNTEYEFSFSATDPDDDDVYIRVYWGDDTYTEWEGPYNSGQTVTFKHTWTALPIPPIPGTILTCQAKDINGQYSPEAQYPVILPRNVNGPRGIIFTILERLFEQHPIFILIFNILMKIHQK
jgi:hypothetical protein